MLLLAVRYLGTIVDCRLSTHLEVISHQYVMLNSHRPTRLDTSVLWRYVGQCELSITGDNLPAA